MNCKCIRNDLEALLACMVYIYLSIVAFICLLFQLSVFCIILEKKLR